MLGPMTELAYRALISSRLYDPAPRSGANRCSAKSAAFKPVWGLRKQDSVVGSSIHAKDRSFHSIPPCDYKDIVLGTDPEVSEQMGAQAIANGMFLSPSFFLT